MTSKKKFLFSFILIGFSLLLLEGLSAVGLMVLDSDGGAGFQQYDYHPLRKQVYKTNHYVRSDWQSLRTDENGYIITPGAPENPRYTVVLTGSSSARSTKPYTAPEHTLAALLQTELNERYRLNAQVINLSVAGYSAFHEHMTLYEYFESKGGRADVVVTANGLYSIDGLARHLKKRIQKGDIYPLYKEDMANEVNAIMDGSLRASMGAFGKFVANLDLNTMQLFKRLMLWLDGKKKAGKPKGAAVDYKTDERAKVLYKKLLAREYELYGFMDDMAEHRGAPYVLALLPARYSWSSLPKANFEQMKSYARRKWFVDQFYDDFKARDPDYSVLDLRGAFDDFSIEEAPYDEGETVHYNPLGMRVLAQSIAPEVVRLLRENHERE